MSEKTAVNPAALSALSAKFTTDSFSFSLSSNTNLDLQIKTTSAAKTGYTPISAMVGDSWDNTQWIMSAKIAYGALCLQALHIGTSTSSITVDVIVLYQKN